MSVQMSNNQEQNDNFIQVTDYGSYGLTDQLEILLNNCEDNSIIKYSKCEPDKEEEEHNSKELERKQEMKEREKEEEHNAHARFSRLLNETKPVIEHNCTFTTETTHKPDISIRFGRRALPLEIDAEYENVTQSINGINVSHERWKMNRSPTKQEKDYSHKIHINTSMTANNRDNINKNDVIMRSKVKDHVERRRTRRPTITSTKESPVNYTLEEYKSNDTKVNKLLTLSNDNKSDYERRTGKNVFKLPRITSTDTNKEIDNNCDKVKKAISKTRVNNNSKTESNTVISPKIDTKVKNVNSGARTESVPTKLLNEMHQKADYCNNTSDKAKKNRSKPIEKVEPENTSGIKEEVLGSPKVRSSENRKPCQQELYESVPKGRVLTEIVKLNAQSAEKISVNNGGNKSASNSKNGIISNNNEEQKEIERQQLPILGKENNINKYFVNNPLIPVNNDDDDNNNYYEYIHDENKEDDKVSTEKEKEVISKSVEAEETENINNNNNNNNDHNDHGKYKNNTTTKGNVKQIVMEEEKWKLCNGNNVNQNLSSHQLNNTVRNDAVLPLEHKINIKHEILNVFATEEPKHVRATEITLKTDKIVAVESKEEVNTVQDKQETNKVVTTSHSTLSSSTGVILERKEGCNLRPQLSSKRVLMNATNTKSVAVLQSYSSTAAERANLLAWQNVCVLSPLELATAATTQQKSEQGTNKLIKLTVEESNENRNDESVVTNQHHQHQHQRYPAVCNRNADDTKVRWTEIAGELVEMDGKLHNVLAQLHHYNRPDQPSYPPELPMTIDLAPHRRRPHTPRSFYGSSGPKLGATWFKGALDNAGVIDSPNLSHLEQMEEIEKAKARGIIDNRNMGLPVNKIGYEHNAYATAVNAKQMNHNVNNAVRVNNIHPLTNIHTPQLDVAKLNMHQE